MPNAMMITAIVVGVLILATAIGLGVWFIIKSDESTSGGVAGRVMTPARNETRAAKPSAQRRPVNQAAKPAAPTRSVPRREQPLVAGAGVPVGPPDISELANRARTDTAARAELLRIAHRNQGPVTGVNRAMDNRFTAEVVSTDEDMARLEQYQMVEDRLSGMSFEERDRREDEYQALQRLAAEHPEHSFDIMENAETVTLPSRDMLREAKNAAQHEMITEIGPMHDYDEKVLPTREQYMADPSRYPPAVGVRLFPEGIVGL